MRRAAAQSPHSHCSHTDECTRTDAPVQTVPWSAAQTGARQPQRLCDRLRSSDRTRWLDKCLRPPRNGLGKARRHIHDHSGRHPSDGSDNLPCPPRSAARHFASGQNQSPINSDDCPGAASPVIAALGHGVCYVPGSTPVLRAQGGRLLPHVIRLQEVALREVVGSVAPLLRLHFLLHNAQEQDEVRWPPVLKRPPGFFKYPTIRVVGRPPLKGERAPVHDIGDGVQPPCHAVSHDGVQPPCHGVQPPCHAWIRVIGPTVLSSHGSGCIDPQISAKTSSHAVTSYVTSVVLDHIHSLPS